MTTLCRHLLWKPYHNSATDPMAIACLMLVGIRDLEECVACGERRVPVEKMGAR